MFTVFDSKVEAFLPPMFMQSRGAALRSFGLAANSTDHEFAKFAPDFTLFEVGEFDDSSGSVKMYEAKVNLGTALEHRAPPQANA